MPRLSLRKKYTIPIALDSGAFSIYHRQFAPKLKEGRKLVGVDAKGYSNYSYATSKEFKDYQDSYVSFLKKNGHHFEFYATLDVIYQPENTFAIFNEMRKEGLNPLPVIHYGADKKWLHKYMDLTNYIGLGGLGSTMTKKAFIPFGDWVFKTICDSKGRPKWKIHGFAVASFPLLQRYPWYSIDSTTCRVWANFGQLMLPRKAKIGKGYDFLVPPVSLPVSELRSRHNRHVGLQADSIHDGAYEYIHNELGFSKQEVMEDHWIRSIINYYFMNRNVEALVKHHREILGMPEYQLYYYASGISEGGVWRTIDETFSKLKSLDATKRIRYLGTFYKEGRRLTQRLLEGRTRNESK